MKRDLGNDHLNSLLPDVQVDRRGFLRGCRTGWMYDAHSSNIDAGVAWYGGLGPAQPAITTTPLDIVDKLHGPVLGLYGGADQGIPQEQVDKLAAAHRAVQLVDDVERRGAD